MIHQRVVVLLHFKLAADLGGSQTALTVAASLVASQPTPLKDVKALEDGFLARDR